MKVYSGLCEGLDDFFSDKVHSVPTFVSGSVFGKLNLFDHEDKKYVAKTLNESKSEEGIKTLADSFNSTRKLLVDNYSNIIQDIVGTFVFKGGYGFDFCVIQEKIDPLPKYYKNKDFKKSMTDFTLESLDLIQKSFDSEIEIIPDIQLKNIGIINNESSIQVKIYDTYPCVGKIYAGIVDIFVENVTRYDLVTDHNRIYEKLNHFKKTHDI